MFVADTRRVSSGLLAALSGLVFIIPSSTAMAATLHVSAGGDLQAALYAAQPGDEIVLQAGATFTGEFVLEKKAGVVVLRSSAALPERRVTPADAPLMPTLRSGSPMSVLSGMGAANWVISGIRFEPTTNGSDNLIALQDADNIQLDRILFVAPEAIGQRRAIMGNGTRITLRRSHIAGVWAQTLQDSQAFCAWDGAGPYTIVDNYLEAASENVMFGGANSKSPSHVPADILVEGNHFSKRLEWKGRARAVKNLFELKSAKRVVVRNNLFERNWTDAQAGTAILFTVRNDEGDSPWSVVEDVLFENNVIRDTEGVFSVLGYDGYYPSGRTTRITLRNNLAIGTGTFLTAGSEVGTLILDNNTADQGGNFATLYTGHVWVAGTHSSRPAQYAVESLTVTNSIGNHNDYGVWGEGATELGGPALTQLTRSLTWTHNVLAGEQYWYSYPMLTWRPSVPEHRAQFNSDYTLVADSWYRYAGTMGQDLGFVPAGSSTPPPSVSPEPAPAPEPAPEPEPPPAPPTVSPTVDTTGPSVAFRLITQNPNFYKFRVDASDPSGIGLVEVWFNGQLIRTSTTVPVDADAALRGLASGTYPLVIRVSDGLGNQETLNRTVTK
jgi:hypothetical protein